MLRRALVFAGLAASGCVEDPGLLGVAKVTLLVTIEEDGIDAAAVPPTQAHKDHAADAALLVEMRDDSGRLLYSELVADPRSERREWIDGRDAHSEIVERPSASFTVTLPGAEGDLVVFEDGGAGYALGHYRVDPLAPVGSALIARNAVGPRQSVGRTSNAANAVDVVFVPEGYTSGQMSDFYSVVDGRIRELEDRPDWGQFRDSFSFWTYEAASRQSGVDTPERQVDSAFDYSVTAPQGRSGMRRARAGNEGYRLVQQLRADAGAEVIVVVINSPDIRSDAGGGVVNLAPDDLRPGVISHELGHAVLGLADEYSETGGTCLWTNSPNVSVSPDRSQLAWADLVDPSTELPTPTRVDSIGAYQGAATCESAYRPTPDCMMRSNSASVCPICRRVMDRYFGVHQRNDPNEQGHDDGHQEGQDWTCEPGFRGGNDGCDCGCGEIDPDCAANRGCADPGCMATGCQYCYQAGGRGFVCPDNDHRDDDGIPDAWNCDPGYYDGDDGCDCGCGAYDPDCGGNGGCIEGGCFAHACNFCYRDGASIECVDDGSDPQDDGPRDCNTYDWTEFCLEDDDYCDEGDGCCPSDSDNHDGGPCRNGNISNNQDDEDDEGGNQSYVDCDEEYDWSTHCYDGDNYCDENDGCCGSDSDNHDGGPCDGSYDDGVDWTEDEEEDVGGECDICDGETEFGNGGSCDCPGAWRVVWVTSLDGPASQVCRNGSWVTFNLDPRDPDACCSGDFWGCCRDDQSGAGCS